MTDWNNNKETCIEQFKKDVGLIVEEKPVKKLNMKLQEISPFVRYVRYLKVEQNTYFPPFVPVDARLFYVCRGKGVIEVENNIIEILEGQILFINSGVKYSHMPCEASYLAVNFDFTNNFAHLEIPINNINPIETENYGILNKESKRFHRPKITKMG